MPPKRINLNAATEEDLVSLPGIGESKAKAIVSHRHSVGHFRSLEELNCVKGFGSSTIQTLKNKLFCKPLMKRKSDSKEESKKKRICKTMNIEKWLNAFRSFSVSEQSDALEQLVQNCAPSQAKSLMASLESQFQRDFISLLPKELALYVLSFLSARDLVKAAQTCRYWLVLVDDNLLWKEKCEEDGVLIRQTPSFKKLYLEQLNIEHNWKTMPTDDPLVLKGHDDHVITCLEYSGDRIVSGSDDNTLKVWNSKTGMCVLTLQGHTGGVWCSQIMDNKLISGSTDRTLRVWDIETGECLHTLYGHSSTVRCLHWHDELVVSGSRDATLRIWHVLRGECVKTLIGHVAAVRCVQYDGRRVVSGAYDFTVRIWDPETEACLHELQGHTNRVYSLQFDGTYIVSGSLDTSIRVWHAESGRCLHQLTGHQSLTSKMQLRNKLLVSGNADSTVKIWDVARGECLHTLAGPHKHVSAVTCLQLTRHFVITSSDDGTVKLWNLETGEWLRDLINLSSGGSGGVVWRVQSTDSTLVCAVGSRNGTEETKLLVLDFKESYVGSTHNKL
ncbi:unnamed protein product [Dimorphilus gyrociliatus]|uniref:F-box domain-containing protein n=1 Tax=Dimorphilus gyrociliatus TaxID=2664684 RepID=A0A7I8VXN6_9ANNE|nr:unnamed protein product [Dimorphilus gyrociliatus]